MNNDTTNKLIILFIFEKMEMPITDNALLELATSTNQWLSHLDCQIALSDLVKTEFLYRTERDKNVYYSITPEGRECISHFYNKLAPSLQREIADYIKHNRMDVRRNQEYYSHYSKNPDGTFTVLLKIIDPVQTTLEIKLNVANEKFAKRAYQVWKEQAAHTYFFLYEKLLGELI
ncbi:MAG: DUF4364 family protein [Clostridiales bacterium]|jgi:predicted transcriptional regulator|nr:DUF4364 family protein [Clostridiales bacterium]